MKRGPKKLNLGTKNCIQCGKKIKLEKKRDLERKKFCSQSCRAKYYVNNGTIKLLSNSKGQGNPNPPTMEKHHRWKGGIIEKNGYRLIKIQAGKNGYLIEHRKIMEDFLGRKLNKNELVHHIDGDGLNNNIENLVLCSMKEHFTIHHSLINIAIDIAYMLIKSNQIKFNRKTKKYESVS